MLPIAFPYFFKTKYNLYTITPPIINKQFSVDGNAPTVHVNAIGITINKVTTKNPFSFFVIKTNVIEITKITNVTITQNSQLSFTLVISFNDKYLLIPILFKFEYSRI